MKRLIDILLELARCTSGSALVEMTIVAPVAILLMVGAVDFGSALFTQATASKSVHDAARYLGSLSKSTVCNNPKWSFILQKAQNLAVYGTLTAQAGTELIPGWSPNDVQVIVDCAYWGVIRNRVNNIPINTYANFFVTNPTDQQGNIYTEYVETHQINEKDSGLYRIVHLVK